MTELWVERTGIRRYTGRSSRGADISAACGQLAKKEELQQE